MAGIDVLPGGAGADPLRVQHGGQHITNFDRILDFDPAADTIRLENADFTSVGATSGWLWAARFVSAARALDTNDHVIYNRATGELFYDADGTGAAAQVRFAVLTQTVKPILTAADFLVI